PCLYGHGPEWAPSLLKPPKKCQPLSVFTPVDPPGFWVHPRECAIPHRGGGGKSMRRAICTGLSLWGRPKALSWTRNRRISRGGKPFLAVAAALGLAGIISSSEAEAQTLGAVRPFAVLGASTVTNTGPTGLATIRFDHAGADGVSLS